jgi:putative nucleotidyltransferase with HDIG domain
MEHTSTVSVPIGICYQQAKEVFEAYLDRYDREDDKIKLKIVHTYGVVKCSEEAALRMGLSPEDRELAKIIALLHDIGRFEQLKQFHSFQPDTMDHAAYGVELLFHKGMIRQFIEDPSWDCVIETAIALHSDYALRDIPHPQTRLHAMLIRDADKLDNCRVKLEEPIETLLGITPEELGRSSVSPHIAEAFFNHQCILSSQRVTPMDYWVSYIAYFYDINFQESLDIIRENNFISRIIHRIPYQNPETRAIMEQMEEHLLKGDVFLLRGTRPKIDLPCPQ